MFDRKLANFTAGKITLLSISMAHGPVTMDNNVIDVNPKRNRFRRDFVCESLFSGGSPTIAIIC